MTPDPRALAARDCHRNAQALDAAARHQRRKRDNLICELRAEDPKTWSLGNLAVAVGCSKELITHIERAQKKKAGQQEQAASA